MVTSGILEDLHGNIDLFVCIALFFDMLGSMVYSVEMD